MEKIFKLKEHGTDVQEVRLQVHHADPQDRQGRRERGLR